MQCSRIDTVKSETRKFHENVNTEERGRISKLVFCLFCGWREIKENKAKMALRMGD